jgi:hypothetical protein
MTEESTHRHLRCGQFNCTGPVFTCRNLRRRRSSATEFKKVIFLGLSKSKKQIFHLRYLVTLKTGRHKLRQILNPAPAFLKVGLTCGLVFSSSRYCGLWKCCGAASLYFFHKPRSLLVRYSGIAIGPSKLSTLKKWKNKNTIEPCGHSFFSGTVSFWWKQAGQW